MTFVSVLGNVLTTLKPAAGNVDGNGNLLRNDTDMPIV